MEDPAIEEHKDGFENDSNSQSDEDEKYLQDIDFDLVEEEKPYELTKDISFFGLVKAMKQKAIVDLTNARLRKVKSKQRKVDTITSIITMSVLVIYTIEYEAYIKNGMKSDIFNQILRSVLFLLNGFNCFLLYYRFSFQLQLLKILKLKHHKETLRSSGLLRGFLIECLINMIICPPFVDFHFQLAQMSGQITVSLAGFCYTVCLFKSYTLLRLPEQYIKWTDDKSSSICKKNKCKADVSFLVKCEFQRRPYFVVIFSFLVVTLLLGFLMRTYESTYFSPETGDGNEFFQLFFNCFWFMVVTMMTVGFGDGYPLSHIGRFIALIGCILGTMIVSLMVVSLTNTSALTIAEMRVFNEANRREKLDEIKSKAAILLHHIFEVYILNKRLRPLAEDPEKAQEYQDLVYKRFGQLSKVTNMAKELRGHLYRLEMLSSTAEDTLLKLNEGGIEETEDTYKSFDHAEAVRESCSKILADQKEINMMVDIVIKNQNCLSSFITKLHEFYKTPQDDMGVN